MNSFRSKPARPPSSPFVASVWWGNGSNSPQLVRGNDPNSLYPTVSGATRDSGNTGTNVCSTHATGMRPGILTSFLRHYPGLTSTSPPQKTGTREKSKVFIPTEPPCGEGFVALGPHHSTLPRHRSQWSWTPPIPVLPCNHAPRKGPEASSCIPPKP